MVFELINILSEGETCVCVKDVDILKKYCFDHHPYHCFFGRGLLGIISLLGENKLSLIKESLSFVKPGNLILELGEASLQICKDVLEEETILFWLEET